MQNKSAYLFMLLGLIGTAQANEATLTSNQPVQIVYRMVRQTLPNAPVMEVAQTMTVNSHTTLELDPMQADRVGIVVLSMNGHAIPAEYSQFNNPNTCAITTSKDHPHGGLMFRIDEKMISCSSLGAVA